MFDYKNEAEIRRYQQMLRIEAGRKVLDQINGKTRQISCQIVGKAMYGICRL